MLLQKPHLGTTLDFQCRFIRQNPHLGRPRCENSWEAQILSTTPRKLPVSGFSHLSGRLTETLETWRKSRFCCIFARVCTKFPCRKEVTLSWQNTLITCCDVLNWDQRNARSSIEVISFHAFTQWDKQREEELLFPPSWWNPRETPAFPFFLNSNDFMQSKWNHCLGHWLQKNPYQDSFLVHKEFPSKNMNWRGSLQTRIFWINLEIIIGNGRRGDPFGVSRIPSSKQCEDPQCQLHLLCGLFSGFEVHTCLPTTERLSPQISFPLSSVLLWRQTFVRSGRACIRVRLSQGLGKS